MKILSCQNTISFVDSLTNFKKKDILFNSISSFEDKEMLVKIEKQNDLKNQDVLVVQSLSNNINDAIVELLFTLDIVRLSSPNSVKLLLTYMSYSRQDTNANPIEAFSAKVISQLFSLNYISKIYVVDVHAEQTIGFFDRPALNIRIDNLTTEIIKKKFHLSNAVLISSNSQDTKRIINMAENLKIEYALALKYRPAASQNKILSIIGTDVTRKDCIILDDVVDSAGTLINVAEKLAKSGANTVNAIITHGIFSNKSIERIKNSYLDKLYVSNTINSDEKIRYIKQVEVFSASDYTIETIINDI